MKIKTLMGCRVMVLPNLSEEKTSTGIILPTRQRGVRSSGIVALKGIGTPYNRMDDIIQKQRVYFPKNAGQPYEEDNEHGDLVKYRILKYEEIELT